MATNFRVKIVKIGLFTFIRRLGFPKWIGILQFRFQKFQWQTFLYIVCKFGEIRSSNPGVYEGHWHTLRRFSGPTSHPLSQDLLG